MFKLGVALSVMLFVVVLGPGLLKLESSQALARDGRHHEADACAETSEAALAACQFAAKEDYNLALGRCENVLERWQDKCEADAKEEFYSALEECDEQFDARQEVCEADGIGPGPYLPRGIKKTNFVSPQIDDNYFPLVPGTTYTYKLYSEGDILETIVVEVTADTREIEEVTCRVVQDTVYEGDLDEPGVEHPMIEDTTDWYALHKNGDVWYFGEIALNYKDGVISNIDGSWTAGVEGAKPGINMFFNPSLHIGETYRQEFALSEAEDVATIVKILLTKADFAEEVGYVDADSVPTVFGDGPFLHSKDFAPLEPGIVRR